MRAASEASMRQGRQVIHCAELGDNYLEIAEEFFGVSDLLGRQSSLVRALTSPSRSAEDKSELARTVFATLNPIVVSAMEALAASRWSAADDIVNASEDLGIETVMAGAKHAGSLHHVEAEIFEVAEFLANNRDVRTALAETRSASVEQRIVLVERLFADKLSAPTITLLKRVVATVQHGRIHSALMRAGRRASLALSTTMVIVEAATKPEARQLERLRLMLERRYETEITMNIRILPELIGGMRVHIGADVIEGSLATSLDHSRRVMVGAHR